MGPTPVNVLLYPKCHKVGPQDGRLQDGFISEEHAGIECGNLQRFQLFRELGYLFGSVGRFICHAG